MLSLKHRLIFIRHGETDWNAESRLQGQRDTPLNGRGRDQATAVGRQAFAWRGPEIRDLPFVASPLSRTRQTMELARAAMGLDPAGYATDPRLIELTFGAWEGFTFEELRARDPSVVAARQADKWTYAPPQGESYSMLASRLAPWVDGLDQEIVVVSHGGVARVLMAMIGGAAPDAAPKEDIYQGRALIFEGGGFHWLK